MSLLCANALQIPAIFRCIELVCWKTMNDCTWKPNNGQQFQPSRPDQRSLVIIWETIEIPPDAFHLDLAWSVIEAACFLHEDVVSWWKTLFFWSFPAPSYVRIWRMVSWVVGEYPCLKRASVNKWQVFKMRLASKSGQVSCSTYISHNEGLPHPLVLAGI